MNTLVALLTLALCLLAPAVTNAAQKTATSNGVEAARGTVWYDQIAGHPVESFPLGCAGDDCHYSLWLEYIPRGQEPVHNMTEPVVDGMDRCAAWVVFHDPILPLRGSSALHFQEGEFVPEALIHAVGRVEPTGHTIHSDNGFTPEAFGKAYQYLKIFRWWIEIAGNNCLMGYGACYHRHAKAFDNEALACPLSD
jgi:hypothetical protein